MSLFMGIDPGKTGGIALISGSGNALGAYKMPGTEFDVAELVGEFSGEHTHALIEKVNGRPRQRGVFAFGQNYGFLRGCLTALHIRFDDIAPGSWQRKMRCLSGGDKRVTKAAAQRLFPNLKVTHATADALLIAECCRRMRQGVEL